MNIKNINRAFKGIWIPAEIWLHEDLSMQEKVFLAEIDSLDNEDGCYATNAYFAKFFGLSKDRVVVIINSLVKKGYLNSTIVYKGDSKVIQNRILKLTPILENTDRVSVETPIPYPQKQGEGIRGNTDTTIITKNITNDNNQSSYQSANSIDTIDEIKKHREIIHDNIE